MQIEALAVEMPRMKNRAHPNRTPFQGVLTVVDQPSQRPPTGARGHRVMLTRAAAEAALPSLIGMALDYTPTMDGHDSRRKVGIITSAEIVGSELVVKGYLFGRDFPDLMSQMRSSRDSLGLSYELADVRVENVSAAIWRLTEVTFTGAAILLRNKAAYEGTWIAAELHAASQSFAPRMKRTNTDKGETNFMERIPNTESQSFITITERMAAAAEALNTTITRLEAQHQGLSAHIDRIVAMVEQGQNEDSRLKARVAELEKSNSELRIKLEAGAGVSQPAPAARKTLPAIVTALLAKTGVEVTDAMDAAALDATLAPLSIEQRIAVKSQMAKAGLIA
jgi:hypothetical protein